MFKKIAKGAIGIFLLATPFLASAQSASDTQSQIAALLAQIATMQTQLQGSQHNPVTPSPSTSQLTDDYGTGVRSGASCPRLSVTMQRGSRDTTTGNQVTDLQVFLADHFNISEETLVSGYFGKTTEMYLIKFQSEQGLPAFGIAGSLTRAKIAQLCGLVATTSTSPPNAPQNGPTSIVVNAVSGRTVSFTFTNLPTTDIQGIYVPSLQGVGNVAAVPTKGGSGSSQITIPDGAPSGNYILRVLSINGSRTIIESTSFFIGGTNNQAPVPPASLQTQTGSSAGSLAVTTDASSPAYQVVAGGSSGVALGAFKFRASGEAITLRTIRIAMDDVSANPGDIVQEYIYDGAVLVGTAIMTPNNHAPMRYYAVSTLNTPITIPRDSDKVLTISGDIARIGTSQPAHPGDLISIAIDGATGNGASSGATIQANFGGQFAATTQFTPGARIFRSFPTVAIISLPNDGLVDGRLMRFKVSANPAGEISLAQIAVRLSGLAAGTNGQIDLYAFTDSGYSSPVSQFTAGGVIGGPVSTASAGAYMYFPKPLVIPAGGTYFFELRDSTKGTGLTNTSALSTLLLGQSVYAGLVPQTSLTGKDIMFVWSPNDYTASQFSDGDWTNGLGVRGLSADGISQTRTGSSASPTLTTQTSSITVAPAQQPGNSLAPQSVLHLPFTKFTITAGSSGPINTFGIVVRNDGIAPDSVFSGLVLLDENGTEVGSAQPLNTNHLATLGTSITLQPAQTRTFTVAANMSSSLGVQAGQTVKISVIGVNAGGVVNGLMPFSGAMHTINSTLVACPDPSHTFGYQCPEVVSVPATPPASIPALGTLMVYANNALATSVSNITQADALAKCQTLATQYPGVAGYCLWNGTQIYSVAAPVAVPTPTPTGTLNVYANGTIVYTLTSVTQVDALTKCKTLAAQYPGVAGKCLWNGAEIYSVAAPTPPTPPVTGTLTVYAGSVVATSIVNITEIDALAKCKTLAAQYAGIAGKCVWNGKVIYTSGPTALISEPSRGVAQVSNVNAAQMASVLAALQSIIDSLSVYIARR